MHGIGDSQPIGCAQYTVFGIHETRIFGDQTSQSFAQPQAFIDPALDGQVHQSTRFFCHPKAAVFQAFEHVLAGMTLESDFKIMNGSSTIGGHMSDDAAI